LLSLPSWFIIPPHKRQETGDRRTPFTQLAPQRGEEIIKSPRPIGERIKVRGSFMEV